MKLFGLRVSRAGASPLQLALAAVALAAVLPGCDRGDTRSVGRQVDRAIAATERNADDVGRRTAEVVDQVAAVVVDASREAAATVAEKSKDLAITTAVNARLASDPVLATQKIDVQTHDARVTLRGSVPDAASRGHAVALARSVTDVAGVADELEVSP